MVPRAGKRTIGYPDEGRRGPSGGLGHSDKPSPMSLRSQALLEFSLPAAPQRLDELPAPAPGAESCLVHTPAGRFLLMVCSRDALRLAFETTLFDLLAEARYPAPRPRRARGGALIAPLQGEAGAAAACYAWPAGEHRAPAAATVPQLMDVGRLLARLHQLGEAHPASVADAADGASLLAGVPGGRERDAIAPILKTGLPALPSGAVHGGLCPHDVLFAGDRCSAILPSGHACSGRLLLDVAVTAVGWLLDSPGPIAAVRAILSGYQALRRLLPEEIAAVHTAFRFAAARDAARRITARQPSALAALEAVDALGDSDVRAAAGD